jgi:hypothetical protein
VLFAGDAAARGPNGRILSVFNADCAEAAASFRRLAGLSVAVACFGHGDPLTGDASAVLGAAAQSLPAGLHADGDQNDEQQGQDRAHRMQDEHQRRER